MIQKFVDKNNFLILLSGFDLVDLGWYLGIYFFYEYFKIQSLGNFIDCILRNVRCFIFKVFFIYKMFRFYRIESNEDRVDEYI